MTLRRHHSKLCHALLCAAGLGWPLAKAAHCPCPDGSARDATGSKCTPRFGPGHLAVAPPLGRDESRYVISDGPTAVEPFAWADKFKRLLLRVERIQQRHFGMKVEDIYVAEPARVLGCLKRATTSVGADDVWKRPPDIVPAQLHGSSCICDTAFAKAAGGSHASTEGL